MAAHHVSGPAAHRKELNALMRANAHRHRLHEVFSDFCELAALSISNAADRPQFEAREARYLQIVSRYDRSEVERFPRMLAVLVEWMECGFSDCLGELFMSLELGDHWKGQYFTSFSVASLMARITMGDVKEQLDRVGFITVCEPACGAGGMLIACADAIQAQGVNPQASMHATAIDIDATAVHMTYVHLSLLHIPAIVIHGNALTGEERGHWVTPAHVLGGWDWRLRSRGAARSVTRRRCSSARPCQLSTRWTQKPKHKQAIRSARRLLHAGSVNWSCSPGRRSSSPVRFFAPPREVRASFLSWRVRR